MIFFIVSHAILLLLLFFLLGFSIIIIVLLFVDSTCTSVICYIIIHFWLFFLFCCSLYVVEMGGVSSKITQATHICTDELFTDKMILYIYMSVIRFVVLSSSRVKKFVMVDDNFLSCHSNSIKPLNILVIIMKWSDNRFLVFFSPLNTVRVNELDCPQRWDMRHASMVYYQQLSEFNKDELLYILAYIIADCFLSFFSFCCIT